MKLTTLPTESKERKGYPIFDGAICYFPAAIAGVSRVSKLGNDQHNPGQPLFHDRSKSKDHGNCIIRHLIDLQDLLAHKTEWTKEERQEILDEVSRVAWRALCLSQELHEKFGAPLAPGAKLETPVTSRLAMQLEMDKFTPNPQMSTVISSPVYIDGVPIFNGPDIIPNGIPKNFLVQEIERLQNDPETQQKLKELHERKD